MAELIFLLGENDNVELLVPAGFPTEDELQFLVAKFPELLGGERADRTLRLALVKREAGVPDADGGSNRWALDHLFVDAESIPTFVEVKRASDTRLRREVIGQILDYGANGSRYWQVDDVRRWFTLECANEALSEVDALQQLAGRTVEPDEFWNRFSDNLAVGRVRLVIVADLIPPELERIIEFLSAQMIRAEILGIELRQFASGERKTLVPRVVGGSRPGENSINSVAARSYAERLADAPEAVREVTRRMMSLAAQSGLHTHETRTACCFENEDRRGVTLYPSSECLELTVGPLIERLGDAPVQPLLDSLNAINGRPITMKSPTLRCDDLIRHWELFEVDSFPAYIDAWRKVAATNSDPVIDKS